jgi:23S rRNA A2030 N6-methylase RlmJ
MRQSAHDLLNRISRYLPRRSKETPMTIADCHVGTALYELDTQLPTKALNKSDFCMLINVTETAAETSADTVAPYNGRYTGIFKLLFVTSLQQNFYAI